LYDENSPEPSGVTNKPSRVTNKYTSIIYLSRGILYDENSPEPKPSGVRKPKREKFELNIDTVGFARNIKG